MANTEERFCYFDPYNWTEKDDEIADRLAGVGLGFWPLDETLEESMAMDLPNMDYDKLPDVTQMTTYAARDTCRPKTKLIAEVTMAMELPDVHDDDDLPDETDWSEEASYDPSELNSEDIAAMTIPKKKKWKRLRRFLRSIFCCCTSKTVE